MKTTIDIHDDLMRRAKEFARQSRQPVRALVEEGLRRVLDDQPRVCTYRLADWSVGDPGDDDPLEQLSWTEQRDLIYGRGGVNDSD